MKTFLTSCVAIFALFFLLSPSISFAETISLSPQIVTSGQYLVVPQQFTVNWTAPEGHSSFDWVGIFAPGTPSESYLTINHLNSAETSGAVTVTVPQSLPPGNYEVRYFINNQFVEPNPTVRAPLTIIPAEARTLTLPIAPIISGQYLVVPQQFTINWTAPAGHSSTDWVGIFVPGTPSDSYLSFNWLNSTETSGATLVTVPQSLPPGNYEIRYFLNNSFAEPDPAVRIPFTIIPAEARMLTLSPATVISTQYLAASHTFDVNWTAPEGHSSTDWVGIFVPGNPPNSYLSFNHINSIAKNGTTLVTVPQSLPSGTYEVRYMLNNSFSEPDPTVRTPLTIIPAELPTLTLSPVTPGQPFSVNWTAPEEHGNLDWIGLFVIGTPNSAYTALAYLNSTATSGTVTFTAPPTLENYEVRYLVNNSFVEPEPAVRVALLGATSTIFTLINPIETEDDGNQDTKGVAGKTNFTFGISYTGATAPSDVTLWTNDGSVTSQYPLSHRLDLWEVTRTFPKGHYSYHFEANGGAQRFPAIGELEFTTGYSNVAFLPGLEASRLYRVGIVGGTKLWLPGTSADVKKLYLDPTTGESADSTVYSPDVLKTAYGVNIYQGFLDRINEMTTSGDIEQFETFPYDWRKDQKDAATQLVSTGPNGEFYSMILRLEEMASTSPTGKATLVTHSNGGLVAKELVEILRRQGKANMVDRIIMVAAPQLGTPKAIFEMLHGAEPFVVGIPNKEVTRELAENMKSAYTLLPSREYFNHLRTPLIRPLVEFSTTTPATQNFRNLYGDSISDYDTLRSFLRGENDVRTAPEPSDVNTPNVLKENFLANAEIHHAFEDSWTPPSGIEVVQVIGWGITTPRGVEYKGIPNPPCVGFANCTPKDLIDPQPLTTIEGDGTVVYSSAAAMDGEKYFIDLGQHNAWWQFNINRDHKNILEVTPIQNLIATLIKNKSADTLPQYITTTKPVVTDADQRLRIGVHSPVALNLYDSLGRHTGPTPNPDLASDFEINEEQIPNSYYWQIGEGQYAGADGTTTTTIELKGTATGTFTLDIENIIGDVTATTTVYEDVPVTASTTAIIQVSSTTTTPLLLDIDGDGKMDASITAGGLTEEDLTGILKGLVKTLHLPVEKEKKLIKKIEKLEKELAKEHKNEKREKHKTDKAFENLIQQIKKFEKKGVLTHDEAVELISVIEQIRQTVVK